MAVTLAACSANPESDAATDLRDPAVVAVLPSPEPALDECSTENLTVVNPGQLTVGVSGALEEPYFVDGQPGNREGFESALVYAVAEGLGLRPTQVDWRLLDDGDPVDLTARRVDFLVGRIPIVDAPDGRQYSIPYLQESRSVADDLEATSEPAELETTYALAFPPGDPLVVCVDGVMAELVADGELQDLYDTWILPEALPETRVVADIR